MLSSSRILLWLAPTLLALCSPSTARPQQSGFNYDEENVPEYELPDLLTAADGSAVTSAEAWRGRRVEILELFREEVYGRSPAAPEELRIEVLEEATGALDGLALRKQVRIHLGADGPSIDLLVYSPANAVGPAPAFLAPNYYGNASVIADPGIRLSECWISTKKSFGIVDNRNTEATRGVRASRWDIEAMLKRGYAFATFCYNDVDPDVDDEFKNGVHARYTATDQDEAGARLPNAWGSIGAWAWGLSRCLDTLETDASIDATRVAVMGHSRLGKTSLWAGAQDERFALVISNNSGCGGAALSRRRFGETVARITTAFPHWFCDNFDAYVDREGELPVDQHMLLALVAPRPLYVASATEDLWADPRGEFEAAKAAAKVYELLGAEGLPAEQHPAPDQPSQGGVAYHLRTGPHGVTAWDWAQYLDFADKHLKRD
ncbi:MAG: hypothetical protein ACI8QS_000607 [Planctomycetota bacterium]|jgi:hypothetical protein